GRSSAIPCLRRRTSAGPRISASSTWTCGSSSTRASSPGGCGGLSGGATRAGTPALASAEPRGWARGRAAPTTPAPARPRRWDSPGSGRRRGGLRHLAEPPGRDVEHEPADLVGVRDERAGLDPRDALADVGVDVAERLRRPVRLDPGVLVDAGLEIVVAEREH